MSVCSSKKKGCVFFLRNPLKNQSTLLCKRMCVFESMSGYSYWNIALMLDSETHLIFSSYFVPLSMYVFMWGKKKAVLIIAPLSPFFAFVVAISFHCHIKEVTMVIWTAKTISN